MTDPTRPDPDPSLDTVVSPTPSLAATSDGAPAEAAAPLPASASVEPAVPAEPAVPVEPDVAAPAVPAGIPDASSAPVVEPAAAAIATTPVAASAPSRPKRGRARWAIALAVVAVVVLASAAAAFVLTAGSSTATILGYVPTDSVAYGEVRLDLPGDQKQAVGEFLSKFPGFQDQAALDTKLDEVLDKLVAKASNDKQTFTNDIKPWFDGEVGFAVGPLPTAAAGSDPAAVAAQGRALLLLSIKDVTKAQAWFDGLITESGTTTTTQDYDGVKLTVFADAKVTAAQAAFAIVDDKVALAGDLASVKAAIDTDGNGGLAGDPNFTAASGAIDADHIGFVYVDLQSIMDSAMAVTSSDAGMPQVSQAMLAQVPDWVASGLRVESDALVMDSAFPHNAKGADKNHANAVANWAPPTTVVLAAGNDVGANVQKTIDQLRQDPTTKDAFAGIDQAIGMLGGLDAVVGWMGDGGLVISQDGSAVEGGIVVVPTDAAAGKQLLTTLRSFVSLGGAQAGITARDVDYKGTTITVIDLGSAQNLVGMAGAMGGAPVPTDPSSLPLPTGSIELSYAATDEVVVIGSGPDFVKSVLDAGAGQSLADEARYSDLIGRVGKEHTGVTFVDIAAIRGILEGMMASAPADQKAEYDESIKPFLTPFDAFAAATSVSTELDTQRAIITVK
jgi:hypothetical protein